jgi:hypothetical protein
MSFGRKQVVAAVAGLALLAACKDSQGPGSLSDPAAVSAELASMDSAFAGPAFQSFAELAPLITPAAGGALARASVIVDGSTPELQREPAYVWGVRRANAWRQLVPQVAALSAGPIIPDPILGTSFEWDTASNAYVATSRAGAPTNGVRFYVYAINSITHQPVEPVTEVGYVDLMDESAGSTLKLHIQVKGTGGTPTYLDYTATIVTGSSRFTATVNGSLTNGLTGLNDKTLTFTLTFDVTQTAVTAGASFDLNNPAVGVDVWERITVGQNGLNVTEDFRFTRPGEMVRITGTVALQFTQTGLLITGDVVVTVNGGIFARLHVSGETQQWTKWDNSPLTADELQALRDLFGGIERFFDFLEHLLDPLEDLIA